MRIPAWRDRPQAARGSDEQRSHATPAQYIKAHIRTVPDWPAPGVQFRDITPLLSNPRVFRVLIDPFVHRYFEGH